MVTYLLIVVCTCSVQNTAFAQLTANKQLLQEWSEDLANREKLWKEKVTQRVFVILHCMSRKCGDSDCLSTVEAVGRAKD